MNQAGQRDAGHAQAPEVHASRQVPHEAVPSATATRHWQMLVLAGHQVDQLQVTDLLENTCIG